MVNVHKYLFILHYFNFQLNLVGFGIASSVGTIYQRGSCMGVDINMNEFMLNGGYGVKSAKKSKNNFEVTDGHNNGQSGFYFHITICPSKFPLCHNISEK